MKVKTVDMRHLFYAREKLSLSGRAVCDTLWDLSDESQSVAYPGHRPLSKMLKLSANTTRRAITELREYGLLQSDDAQIMPKSELQLMVPEYIELSAEERKTWGPALGIEPPPSKRQLLRDASEAYQAKRVVQAEAEELQRQVAEQAITKETGSGTLDEQAITAITSSLERMELYITRGREAAIAGTAEGYKPSQLDWRNLSGWTVQDPKVAQWTVNQFAGYYWFAASWVRTIYVPPLPLTIPAWGRLIGDMRNRLKRETPDQLFRRICTMTDHWIAVLQLVGKDSHTRVFLDERSMSNNLIQQQVDTIQINSDDWLDDVKKKYRRQ